MSRLIVRWLGGVVAAAMSLGLAGCDGTVDGAGATGGSGGFGGEQLCDNGSGVVCAANEYCDDQYNACGWRDEDMGCSPRPQACEKIYKPVCTCAGTIVANECTAYSLGLDLSAMGGCTAPEGMFACGPGFCDKATQYCRHSVSDIVGQDDVHACEDLPPACTPGAATCGCLWSEACAWMCAKADGGVTLTCGVINK